MDDSTQGIGLPIVVGVDGSPQSLLALKWAKKLAVPLGAGIKAVTTWHLEVTYGPYTASDWDAEAVAHQVLAQALLDAFGDGPPDGLTAECHRGQPAQVLMEQGKSAQLLILGSRGHGGFAGLLLGSVSSACVAHAKCPVLVVHASDDPDAAQGAAIQRSERRDVDEPAGGV
ncbi:universal stress protein [Arthrobacter sp. SDTb3-6]|uniref:universal stress protein n=1 Tax=Arthrobacter sp. SDTb3-6 TaxID=2713571 RepID=UPI00159D1E9E|nr:universal stress protein [Arthrobacter sp. SDTb3-6]NVM99811.1 universal stress protein [Arthrobacter sp. SDTb3-6]